MTTSASPSSGGDGAARTLGDHGGDGGDDPRRDDAGAIGGAGGGAARPLRVLRVITRLPPGGIERRMVALLPKLRARGIEPEVAILHAMGGLTEELAALGIPVHFCRFPFRWHPGALWRLARLIRAREIDLVHAHMYRSNVPATVAARLAGRPVVAQVHNVGTWETRRQRWMDRALVRWRAGMIAVSERVADDIVRQLGCPRERVHVLYNGVDLGRFGGDATARRATRASLGLAEEEVAFLCPARLHPQKNHAALIEGFARAVGARGAGGDGGGGTGARALVLMLAGAGGEHDALVARARDLGMQVVDGAGQSGGGSAAQGAGGAGGANSTNPTRPRVLFLGHRDDMPELYAAADAMVLVSAKEGFSNAVIEAMACGLPVVLSDVGGNGEALGASGGGVLLGERPGIDEIAGALGRLADDPVGRGRMAEAARARTRLFDLEAMADATARLYRDVLGGAVPSATRGPRA